MHDLTQYGRAMNINDWSNHVRGELGIDLDPDLGSVLRTARDVSHTVARPAAPVTAFLIGYAAGLRGGSSDDVADVTEVIQRLVAEWPDQAEDEPSGT